MHNSYDTLRAVRWDNNALHLLDQRQLPHQQITLSFQDAVGVATAIKDMVVRGAPAIGIAASYGVVLAATAAYQAAGEQWRVAIEKDMHILMQSRPTAVNLAWALQRMQALFATLTGNPVAALLAEAQKIHEEDIAANYAMGKMGAAFLPATGNVLTHCNTGSLATGGYGTALGVIRSAYSQGKLQKVYADETRPWMQGARLTAWELVQDNIPVTLIVEGAAAYLMQKQQVQWVIVGADRITANGDTANKIGTYSLAVLARHHGVKFMVVAPSSTVDMALATGNEIVIEERAAQEVTQVHGQAFAAGGTAVWNPAFDVTPASLIDVIVTEKGAIENPTTEKMRALMGC